LLPYFLYYQGKTLQGMGKLSAACEALEEACQTAAMSGARYPWWRCLACLADIHELLGMPEQAEADRQAARQIIDYICQHAGTADLRLQFELHEDVRRIYNN
jgi:hypothetical protein